MSAAGAQERSTSYSPTAAAVTTPDWTPPSVPAGLVAAVVSSGEIDLSWNAVYRNGSAIATSAAGILTYADTGVGHGFTYSYAVAAFDTAGNASAPSAPVPASTPDDVPPGTPGNFSAVAGSPTSVRLAWSAATDNVAVTGCDVFRDGAPLATLGPGALAYTDTVAGGSTHTYATDAFDSGGNHSGQAPPQTVTTPMADTIPVQRALGR